MGKALCFLFSQATLERAVEVCKATTDPVFEVFESETLTMAMGLLTAVLTGAMQVRMYFLFFFQNSSYHV